MQEAEKSLTVIEDLYDIADDRKYSEYLTSDERKEAITELRTRLLKTYSPSISAARDVHAQNYAERVFHDR